MCGRQISIDLPICFVIYILQGGHCPFIWLTYLPDSHGKSSTCDNGSITYKLVKLYYHQWTSVCVFFFCVNVTITEVVIIYNTVDCLIAFTALCTMTWFMPPAPIQVPHTSPVLLCKSKRNRDKTDTISIRCPIRKNFTELEKNLLNLNLSGSIGKQVHLGKPDIQKTKMKIIAILLPSKFLISIIHLSSHPLFLL